MKYISQTMDFTSYKNGKYITTITDQYYMSTSVDEPIGGSWTDIVDNATLPIEKDQYRFRRQEYEWSDGDITYSAARLDETDQRIMDWCMDNNTTWIDGAKIYTGTVTADKLTVYKRDDAGNVTENIVFNADANTGEVQINKVTATEGTIGGWKINEEALVSTSNTMGLRPDPSSDILNFPSIRADSDQWTTTTQTTTMEVEFPSIHQTNVVPLQLATGQYIGSAFATITVPDDLSTYTKCVINNVEIGTGWTEVVKENSGSNKITRSAKFTGGVLTLHTSASRESSNSTTMSFLIPSGSMSITLSYNTYGLVINATHTLDDSINTTKPIYINCPSNEYIDSNDKTWSLRDGNAILSLTYDGNQTLTLTTAYTEAIEKVDYTPREIVVSNDSEGGDTCVIWVGGDTPPESPFQVLKDGTVKIYKGGLEINSNGYTGITGMVTVTDAMSLNHESCKFCNNSEIYGTTYVQVGRLVDNFNTTNVQPDTMDGMCVAFNLLTLTQFSQLTHQGGLFIGGRSVMPNADMAKIDGVQLRYYNRGEVKPSLTTAAARSTKSLDGRPFTLEADSLNLTTRIRDDSFADSGFRNILKVSSLLTATVLTPTTTHDTLTAIGHLAKTWTSEGAISTSSDRNLKNSIESLSDKYSVLFDSLSPVRFKYNAGTSNRYHTGFIAQDVAAAVEDAGLTTNDFAAYVRDAGTDVRSIRYEEIIALCVNEIQKLKARVAELENKE